jgi:hypothetical protein
MALAGQMWDMRAAQYLLANGVAILQPNPAAMDVWEWYDQPTWDSGKDQPFLTELFGAIRNRTFGATPDGVGAPINLDQMVVSGYAARLLVLGRCSRSALCDSR